jgi:2-polyprenyl-3-methyl-5-hydroxy-6-metoxy-1,4-benzoquinol methylase
MDGGMSNKEEVEDVFSILDEAIDSDEVAKRIAEELRLHRKEWGRSFVDISKAELYRENILQEVGKNDLDNIDYNLGYIHHNWNRKPLTLSALSRFPVVGRVFTESIDIQTDFNAHIVRLLTRMNQSRKEMQEDLNEIKGSPEDLPDFNYLRFEEKIRGSDDWIEKNFERYVPYFKGCKRVLDIGCGRGNFLKVLKRHGIGAYGIDTDIRMVEKCQEEGLRVHRGEAVGHLMYLRNEFTDGIFLAQVIEHMHPKQIAEVVRLAHKKMKPGSHFLAETINPTSLFALSHWYTMDPTHIRPVHFETMKFLLEEAGFKNIEILFRGESPPDKVLPMFDESRLDGAEAKAIAGHMNRNIKKINEMLFGSTDYAIVGRK